ncbi:MAG: hypothetical protein ITG00_05500 [Flavobacterium sp.]|nr:hypothetical protein [Flavobacterium sp.]
MILIVNRYLVPKGYRGITVFPFVIICNQEDGNDEVFINHEKIHLRQQAELLIVGFFVWYLTDYLIGLLRFQNHEKAYRHIIFEREAYENEKDLDYLKKRSFWRFMQSI